MEIKEKKKIAIFGACGYLGQQLTIYFTRQGIKCDCFDLAITTQCRGASYSKCDVTQLDDFVQIDFSQYQAVIFFAGRTGTQKSFDDPFNFLFVNEIGLLNLCQVLSKYGKDAPKIIFPSSRLVYKGSNSLLQEEDEKETRTIYAVNKLACEYYLQAYSIFHQLSYVCLRICIPYGTLIDSLYSYGTVGLFIDQAKQKKMITLYGDGSQQRTFTHVEDICGVILGVIQHPIRQGVFNIGGVTISLSDLARMVAKKYQATVESIPWTSEALVLESGGTVFDDSKLTHLLGSYLKHIEINIDSL